MITEIVLFRLPDGMSREDAIAKYRLSVPGCAVVHSKIV